MFGYVLRLQIAYVIPMKTINIVSYNKFSNPGRAGFYAIPPFGITTVISIRIPECSLYFAVRKISNK